MRYLDLKVLKFTDRGEVFGGFVDVSDDKLEDGARLVLFYHFEKETGKRGFDYNRRLRWD